MTLAPGSMIGRYRVESLLGSGGVGAVYLAVHPTLPRRDAVKVLDPQVASSASVRAQFAREADLASTLMHPNIVRVYDAYIHGDGRDLDSGYPHAGQPETSEALQWIAMQYVPGRDAGRELARMGRLKPSRVLRMVTEIASALDYAHQEGCQHRDVKPGNILLTGSGTGPDTERALLTDFGLARPLDSSATIGDAGTIFVSLSYAAPERLLGEPTDGRADQYSLAVTAFHLLAGRTPLRGATTAQLLSAHLSAPVPSLSALAPVPVATDAVFERAMAKDPAQRYASCGEFAAALAETIGVSYRSPAQQVSGRVAARPADPGAEFLPDARAEDGVRPRTVGSGAAVAVVPRSQSVRTWRAIFFVTLVACVIVLVVTVCTV